MNDVLFQVLTMKEVKSFYEKLTTKGLADLTDKQLTQACVHFIKSKTTKDQKILDLACGYGRLTIPLAKAGYQIEGLDIAPNLIKSAKKMVWQAKINIPFKIGDMRSLPYADKSFDLVVCMWSSFCHLLTEQDQIKTLKEMLRVLKGGGLALIDLPYFKKPTKGMLKFGNFDRNNEHLFIKNMGGLQTTLYLHTKKSLSKLLANALLSNYQIKYDNIGGKKRIVLYLNAFEI